MTNDLMKIPMYFDGDHDEGIIVLIKGSRDVWMIMTSTEPIYTDQDIRETNLRFVCTHHVQ